MAQNPPPPNAGGGGFGGKAGWAVAGALLGQVVNRAGRMIDERTARRTIEAEIKELIQKNGSLKGSFEVGGLELTVDGEVKEVQCWQFQHGEVVDTSLNASNKNYRRKFKLYHPTTDHKNGGIAWGDSWSPKWF